MTNFSGTGRKGIWSWLTPERAVLVGPVFAGFGLALALFGFGIGPLTLRVREQSEVVAQLTTKADLVPLLQQQEAALKRKQAERDQQLDRLLELVAGTSQLQTFMAELNDMARRYKVEIITTRPGEVERFEAPTQVQIQDQIAPPAAGGEEAQEGGGDPLLNRGLEKRSAELKIKGPFKQVLAFLRSLESLEVFVVVSEMNIQRKTQQNERDVDLPEVQMDLMLSAYGRHRKALLHSKVNNN